MGISRSPYPLIPADLGLKIPVSAVRFRPRPPKFQKLAEMRVFLFSKLLILLCANSQMRISLDDWLVHGGTGGCGLPLRGGHHPERLGTRWLGQVYLRRTGHGSLEWAACLPLYRSARRARLLMPLFAEASC